MMGQLVAALFIIVLLTLPAAAETGWASFYGSESGSTRADGHRFVPSHVSCAHKTLKLGTWIRVTDLETGRSIRCQVLDRGPYVRGRIVDLSLGAARALGIVKRGVVRVKVTVVQP
jgi:rare lipoprotein A